MLPNIHELKISGFLRAIRYPLPTKLASAIWLELFEIDVTPNQTNKHMKEFFKVWGRSSDHSCVLSVDRWCDSPCHYYYACILLHLYFHFILVICVFGTLEISRRMQQTSWISRRHFFVLCNKDIIDFWVTMKHLLSRFNCFMMCSCNKLSYLEDKIFFVLKLYKESLIF